MWYWNDRNFGSLAAVAADLRRWQGYEDLATYCDLRATGLRRQALAASDAFFSAYDARPLPERALLTGRVLRLASCHPAAHMFLHHRLDRFTEETLIEWCRRKPSSLMACRLWGWTKNDEDALRFVLDRRPDDTDLRRRVFVAFYQDKIDWAFHHLNEGVVLLEPRVLAMVTEQGQALLDQAPDGTVFEQERRTLEKARSVMTSWTEWVAAGRPVGFPEWLGIDAERPWP